MERKIGEIFKFKEDGTTREFLVCKENYGCANCCAFCFTTGGGCESPEGNCGRCQSFYRNDKQDVHFVEIVLKNGMVGIKLKQAQVKLLGFGNLCDMCNEDLSGWKYVIYVPVLNYLLSINCFEEMSKFYSKEDNEIQEKKIQQFALRGWERIRK